MPKGAGLMISSSVTMGTPELLAILLGIVVPILLIVLMFVIGYFVIRNAVAAGILRAEERRNRKRPGDGGGAHSA